MRKMAAIISLLFICCSSPVESNAHFEIINEALNIYSSEVLIKEKKSIDTRINPIFSRLVPTLSTYSDMQMLKDLSLYRRGLNNCENFVIPRFEVEEHLGYYEEQLNHIGENIDFKKIKGDYVAYKNEISNLENKKILEFYENDTTGISQKVKNSVKRQLLHKENGFLEVSYPIISYNKNEAVILISSHRTGYVLWFFERINQKWEKRCERNDGIID